MRDQFKSPLSMFTTSTNLNPATHLSKGDLLDSQSQSQSNPLFRIPSKPTFLSYIFLFFLFVLTLVFCSFGLNNLNGSSKFLEESHVSLPEQRNLALEHVLIFDIEQGPLEWTLPRDIKIDNTVQFEIISKEDISSWFGLNSEKSKFVIKERPSNYKNVTVMLKGFLANGQSYEIKLLVCTRKVKTVLRTIASEFQIAEGNYVDLPQSFVLKEKHIVFGWCDAYRIHLKQYSLTGEQINENAFSIHQEETPAYFEFLKFGEPYIFVFWIKKAQQMSFNYIVYNQDLLAIGARENINAQPYNGQFDSKNLKVINIANNKILVIYETTDYELRAIRIVSEKPDGIAEFSIDKTSCHKDLSVVHMASFQIMLTWTNCDNSIVSTIITVNGEKSVAPVILTDNLLDFSKVIDYQSLSNGNVLVLNKAENNGKKVVCPLLVKDLKEVKTSVCINSNDKFTIEVLDENRLVYVGIESLAHSILILPLSETADSFTDQKKSCELIIDPEDTFSELLPSIFSGGEDMTILCWEGPRTEERCFYISQDCKMNNWNIKSSTGTIMGFSAKKIIAQQTLYTYKTYKNPLILTTSNLMGMTTASHFERGVVPEAIMDLEEKTFYIYIADTLVIPKDLFFAWDSGPLNIDVVMEDGSALPSWMSYDARKGVITAEPAYLTFVDEFRLQVVAINRFGISVSAPFKIKVTVSLYLLFAVIAIKIMFTYCVCKILSRCRKSTYTTARQEDVSQKSIMSEGQQPFKKPAQYNEFRDEKESDGNPSSDGRSQPVVIPEHFFCPITKYIMAVPYDAFSGEELIKTTYEKSAIVESYSKSKVDPVTNHYIYKKTDNLPLRIEIETFLKKIVAENIFNDDFLRDNIKHWIDERGKDNLVRNPMLAGIVYEYLQAVKE